MQDLSIQPEQGDTTFPLGASSGEDPRVIEPGESKIPQIISIDRKVLEDMQEKIAILEQNQGAGIAPEEPDVPTCIIRKYKGNFVLRYGKSWEEKQPDGQYRLMMEVITQGKDKELVHQFDINKFRTSGEIDGVETIEARIIGRKQMAPTMLRQGSTTLKDIKYDQFKTVDTGIEVPVTVSIPNDIMVLKLPDGSEIELPTSAIN